MAEYHLAINTNGSVFLQGDVIKVLCRIVSIENKFADAFLEAEFHVLECSDVTDGPEHPRVDAPFSPSPIERMPGIKTVSLNSDSLKPGVYAIRALDKHPGQDIGVREAQFLILSPPDYEQYWMQIVEERFLEDATLNSTEDFLSCLRRLINESLAQKLKISSIDLGLDLLDRRGFAMFRAFRPIRRAQFEWFYYHLLQACYDKVFYGGDINFSVTLEQDQLTTSALLTPRSGEIREKLPRFLEYILKGLEPQIRIKSSQLSERQVEIITQFPYEDQVAETQKS